jgi:hypothetical protein
LTQRDTSRFKKRRLATRGLLPWPPHSKARKKVVDNENVNNHHRTIVRTYSGALAGIHVLLILDFQDQ